MKKKICVLLLGLCLASSTACGNNVTPDNSTNTPIPSQKEESAKNNDVTADKETTPIGFEELNEVVTADVVLEPSEFNH